MIYNERFLKPNYLSFQKVIEMGCTNCGSGKFTHMFEDERFVYYTCMNCGNTSIMPKGVKLV